MNRKKLKKMKLLISAGIIFIAVVVISAAVQPLRIKDLKGVTDTIEPQNFGCGMTFVKAGDYDKWHMKILGAYDLATNKFEDKEEIEKPDALQINVWADPGPLNIKQGETITITGIPAQKTTIYLPALNLKEEGKQLYVADDGSTYWDASLTQLACAAPKPSENRSDQAQQRPDDYYDAEKVKVIKTYQLTTEGGYSNPKWSPDGSMIAIRKEPTGLTILKLKENKTVKDVLRFPTTDFDAWSPNSKEIVYYTRERNGIFVLNVESGEKKLLNPDGEEPTWSPDGNKVAFIVSGKGLFVINKDGTDLKKVVDDGTCRNPVWFPSGDKIAFTKGPITRYGDVISDYTDETQLYTINPDGTNETLYLPDKGVGDVVWCFGEQKKLPIKMFFSVSDPPKRISDDFIADGDGSKRIKFEYYDFSGFSPDGSKALFVKTEFSTDPEFIGEGKIDSINIWIMNSNGTSARSLTEGKEIWKEYPAWSPDGKHIAYVGYSNVYIMKILRHHE